MNMALARYIITFGSTHKVLKAESALKKNSVPFRLDPAPSQLTAYCSLVITVKEDALKDAKKTLSQYGIKPAAIFRKVALGYIKA